MKSQEWTALAERCEKATGPDREIDVGILLLVDWRTESTRPLREVVPIYQSIAEFAESASRMTSIYSHAEHLPPLTASTDAITALIERELPNVDDVIIQMKKGRASYADIWLIAPLRKIGTVKAATPELALCAAFCLAKAEESK